MRVPPPPPPTPSEQEQLAGGIRRVLRIAMYCAYAYAAFHVAWLLLLWAAR